MTMGNRHLAAGTFVLVCLLGSPLQSRADPPAGTVCPSKDGKSCACKHPKGDIDLTPLAFNTSNTARFTGIKGPSFTYDYNPCYPFSPADITTCADTYICQADQYKLANKGTETIYMQEDDSIIVYYSAPTDGDNPRECRVTLTCDHTITDVNDAVLIAAGEAKVELQYEFTLKSCYACPGGCQGGGGAGSGSGGSVVGYIGIIIILLVLIAIASYFIIGSVILKVHFKKEGSDIIPNKDLWFGLPLLIRDGFKFTFTPCLRKCKKYEGYEDL